MKKIILSVLAIGLSVGAFAQKNATSEQSSIKVDFQASKANTYILPFDSSCATIDSAKIIPVTYQGQPAGYASGHNAYWDLGYAQVYQLPATKSILGVAALMLNVSEQPASESLDMSIMSANFSQTLASSAYDPSDISSSGSMVEVMFSSPVSAQNFALAVNIGDLVYTGEGDEYNFLIIPTGPANCSLGDNSYSYSDMEGTGDYEWVSMMDAYGKTSPWVDLFIFPIVNGDAGLNNVDVNDLTYIYPNPAKNEVILASSYKMDKVEIFNMLGQKVYESGVNGISTTVNVVDFTAGNYVAKLYTDGGVATKKLVIE